MTYRRPAGLIVLAAAISAPLAPGCSCTQAPPTVPTAAAPSQSKDVPPEGEKAPATPPEERPANATTAVNPSANESAGKQNDAPHKEPGGNGKGDGNGIGGGSSPFQEEEESQPGGGDSGGSSSRGGPPSRRDTRDPATAARHARAGMAEADELAKDGKASEAFKTALVAFQAVNRHAAKDETCRGLSQQLAERLERWGEQVNRNVREPAAGKPIVVQ